MRLRLAAGPLTAVMLAAGCSAGGDTGDITGGGVAPSAAGRAGAGPSGAGQNAGDAALTGNTDAICDQAAKTGGEFAATFAQDLKLLIDAESAQDKAQAARVKAKTSRAGTSTTTRSRWPTCRSWPRIQP
jgi:hypothetical protein